ncbi:hypothetical protein HDE68_002950 [Pedobacter cryoconitis]|uniref:Poly A polymerase head domain-containing protein n=1 Tax=Pedobacter cryoconitis TaxID=188932 RepID=A0A7W8ZNH5_9SPHI|nr:hypothetical protein [Pedobacter cryoconitis]MBB5637037.1 hypothetical protein [Pedobacter cryoconitis]
MDKKLTNKFEERFNPDIFLEYLNNRLGEKILGFLTELSQFSGVLVFSGVIRNFFINYYGAVRDFDIVIDGDEVLIENFLKKHISTRNSFGGYKIEVDSVKIDIWHIDKTWAYSNSKVELELFKEYNLPNTAFFNFSSIVFDFNHLKFIVSPSFKNFLDTKEIDLVLEDNPMPQLCIINTIYYMHKFHLNVSHKLKNYCLKHFDEFKEQDYYNIQIKHFSKVKYDYPFLKTYMQIFQKDLLEK